MEEKIDMNKYKIEFKQTFKKEITIFAEDESEAAEPDDNQLNQ